MIADLYIRVSTDEQADKGYSQRDQEERLKKYCEIKGIAVRQVIFEDHSAKTFNRPSWTTWLGGMKKRGNIDLVLFTKWDRFSRNAGDAYQMINTLRKLGIEPQAIEQPLDLSIPENKIMLAFYLASPEVENDRRALNVFHGMRRARKEGRWMGPAPIGYENKTTENNRKYIAPIEPAATIIRWVFETLPTEMYHVEQIWKAAKIKGLKCSKPNFWQALRNPVYAGRVPVRKYKDEEETTVPGLHQAIISEELFEQVQDFLNGKKRNYRKKIHEFEELQLRGHLECPRCGKMLTGSASKGCTKSYFYYHCTSKCGARFRADNANELFLKELRMFRPHPGYVEIFQKIIEAAYKEASTTDSKEIQKITQQLTTASEYIVKARGMLLRDEIDPADFKAIKAENEKRITQLEADLIRLTQGKENISDLLEKAIGNLSRLDELYLQADTKTKRQYISSIFPEKIVFDGEAYRTNRLNAAVELIFNMDKGFVEIENGQTVDISDLSVKVLHSILFSNYFIMDLKRLAALGA